MPDPSAVAAGSGDVSQGNLARARIIAQIRKLVAQEQQLQLEMAIKRDEYVKRAEIEESGALKWRAVRQSFMQVPRALRQILADTSDPAQCEQIVLEALRAICVEGMEGLEKP